MPRLYYFQFAYMGRRTLVECQKTMKENIKKLATAIIIKMTFTVSLSVKYRLFLWITGNGLFLVTHQVNFIFIYIFFLSINQCIEVLCSKVHLTSVKSPVKF